MTFENTADTASAMTSAVIETSVVFAAAKPVRVNDIVHGNVFKILQDKAGQNYGVLLRFGNHIGRLVANEFDHGLLNHAARVSDVKLNDEFLVMVTNIRTARGTTFIDLSEQKAVTFAYIASYEGSRVTGTVCSTTRIGVHLDIGNGCEVLVRQEELTSADTKQRLASLKTGDSMTVVVTMVKMEGDNIVTEASELDAKLQDMSVNTLSVLTGLVKRKDSEGFKIALKEGIEAFLPFDKLGETNPKSLAVGIRVRVVADGIHGRALLVSRKSFSVAALRAQKAKSKTP